MHIVGELAVPGLCKMFSPLNPHLLHIPKWGSTIQEPCSARNQSGYYRGACAWRALSVTDGVDRQRNWRFRPIKAGHLRSLGIKRDAWHQVNLSRHAPTCEGISRAGNLCHPSVTELLMRKSLSGFFNSSVHFLQIPSKLLLALSSTGAHSASVLSHGITPCRAICKLGRYSAGAL